MESSKKKSFPNSQGYFWTHSKSVLASHESYHHQFDSLQTCGIYPWCSFYFKIDIFTLYLTGGLFLHWRECNGLIKDPKKNVKNLLLFQRSAVRPGKKCCAGMPTVLPSCLLPWPATPWDGDTGGGIRLLCCSSRMGETWHGMMTERKLEALATCSFLPTSWDWVTPWSSTHLAFKEHILSWRPHSTHTCSCYKWVPRHQNGGSCWLEVRRVRSRNQNRPQTWNQQAAHNLYNLQERRGKMLGTYFEQMKVIIWMYTVFIRYIKYAIMCHIKRGGVLQGASKHSLRETHVYLTSSFLIGLVN